MGVADSYWAGGIAGQVRVSCHRSPAPRYQSCGPQAFSFIQADEVCRKQGHGCKCTEEPGWAPKLSARGAATSACATQVVHADVPNMRSEGRQRSTIDRVSLPADHFAIVQNQAPARWRAARPANAALMMTTRRGAPRPSVAGARKARREPPRLRAAAVAAASGSSGALARLRSSRWTKTRT